MSAVMECRPQLVTEPAVAQRLAADEYGYRRSGRRWLLLSRGADGGMHARRTVDTEEAARNWEAANVRQLARRILSGKLDGLTLFGTKERPWIG